MSNNITTEHIEGLDNKVVRHKKLVYPIPGDANLPRLYPVCIAAGSRGSGKSYSIAKLLKMYEKSRIFDKETGDEVEQRIILMCPSADSNPIFNSLKHLSKEDTHTLYSDDKLNAIVAEIKQDREDTRLYKEEMTLWKKFMKARKESELTTEEMQRLALMGYQKPSPPKYPTGCVVFLVLDDLISSPAFKTQGKSAVTNLSLRNRHSGICILIAAQSVKGVPKSIRLNTNLWVLYKFCNSKMVMQDIYEEISGLMTEQQFLDAYAFATTEPHSALILDQTGGDPRNRVRMNWDVRMVIPGLGEES
jgi:hypothetical protein